MIEFDCVDCGMHIIDMIYSVRFNPRCAMCTSMPMWFKDPKALLILDRDGHHPWPWPTSQYHHRRTT